MKTTSISVIACVMVVAFAASSANATSSDATRTGKPCGYCHVNPKGGGALNSVGDYYFDFDTIPPPPTVTSITVSSGPNVGTTNITNLAGTTFLGGATVRLKRAGFTDITASSVTVVSMSKITCVFDLTGKKTGLWDVYVANIDGLSGTLFGKFGINLASTAPTVGANIRRLREPVMTLASARWSLRVWGRVQLIDSSSFWLNDGLGSTIKVFAPGYTGLVNNSYVGVTGTADVSTSPTTLISSPAQILKFQ